MISSSFWILLFLTLNHQFETIECNELKRAYILYHDLGNGFVRRNEYIELIAKPDTVDEANTNYMLSASMKQWDENDVEVESCTNEDDDTCNPMSIEEKAILELMMENKFYRIKAVDVETGMESVTSAHPCSIRKANFRESMNLILSPKADLISMDYNPIISPILSSVSCPSFLSYSKSKTSPSLQFQTTSITYTTSTPAMTIPNILPSVNLPKGAIKMLPRDKTKPNSDTSTFTDNLFQKDNEQANQHQSFLRRYWYIILPMMIMSLFGAEEEPQGQGQPNRSDTTATASAASMAPAAATVGASAVASTTRKRRGKRG